MQKLSLDVIIVSFHHLYIIKLFRLMKEKRFDFKFSFLLCSLSKKKVTQETAVFCETTCCIRNGTY